MMHPILANAGVPMLFVQMPFLVMALPVVIAVEAWLCRRWLDVSWKQAWLSTGIANLLSTLAGFPILWIALVAVQMLLGGGGVPQVAEPWYSVYSVTVQAAWLLPDEERLYWMIPTAGIVLLIPAFFVTVLIERWVYRRTFREAPRVVEVTSATWRMHFVTYGLLFLTGVGLLVSSLVTHKGEPDGPANGSQPIRAE
jgi:hypothetical protein